MRFAAWLESVLADMRFGLRQYFRTPLITAAVVVSLAIGVGANTAVFTLLDAAILRPLPVPDADELVLIEWSSAGGFPPFVESIRGTSQRTPGGGMLSASVSAPLHRTLAREAKGFEAIVGIAGAEQVSVAVGEASAEPLDLQYVSANFFQGLNVTPAPGRAFLQEDDTAGATPVVILSHRFWSGRLGGTADVVGRLLRVNDVEVRVVGVAPRGFFGLTAGQWTDLYAPLAARAVLDKSQQASVDDPAYWWVEQVGVLSPEQTEAAALAELSGLFRNELAKFAGDALDADDVPELMMRPGQRGIGAPSAQIRTALWLLMLLVGLLMLVVCANVANLLLVRSEGRLRESAMRLTLGATPARLFRQQAIESLMLAFCGGIFGVTLGHAFAGVVHELFQTGQGAGSLYALRMDARVVWYGLFLSCGAALLFGTSPALRAARAQVRHSLSVHARSISAGNLRGPRMLVAAQLALCLGALVAAGLLGRSLQRLTAIDLGFDPQNLVYATVSPQLSDFPPERIEGYLSDVQRELEALPGVESVTRLARRPLEGGGNFSPVNIPGDPRAAEFDPRFIVYVNNVGREAFDTLRIPLVSGDTVDPTRNGVVVDERFVERYFGGRNAIGRRIGTGAPGNDDDYEIVGVARNAISLRLRAEPLPVLYLPNSQADSPGETHFAIRTSRDPQSLLETIRATVSSVNSSVPLTDLRTQTELLERMLRSERLLAFLSAAFSLMATVLGAIGLAGLLAYAVARRTSEIGVRMALGAAPGQVMAMVMKDSMRLIAAGLLVGMPCAYGIAKLLESSLYELTPADPLTMSASIIALLAICIVAAYLPARRAAMTAPGAALRED